jgi:tetratricopeptide (TPR) repeat protein
MLRSPSIFTAQIVRFSGGSREVRRRSRNLHRVTHPALILVLFAGAPHGSGQTAEPSTSAPSQTTPGQAADQATAAREAGDAPRAIGLYTEALRLNPSWPDGWWYLGQLHYAANDYAEAVDAFTRYLALVPNAGPATALRGLCEFELGEYDASLRDVRQAVALGAADDSRNAQILRYHESLLLTRLGRFEEALTSFSYFAQHNVANNDLFVAAGLAALRLPRLPADLTPPDREMCGLAGNAVFRLLAGDSQGAAQALQDFFRAYPAQQNLHYSWGYLLYATDPDAAIDQFRRELAIDPASAVTHTMLAWALLMAGEPAAALPEAKKAAAAAPALPLAQLSLGRAFLETGDVRSATPVLESALALDPQNLEVHIALARAYSESGREDDARRERLLCLQMTNRIAKPAPAMGQQQEASPAQ